MTNVIMRKSKVARSKWPNLINDDKPERDNEISDWDILSGEVIDLKTPPSI